MGKIKKLYIDFYFNDHQSLSARVHKLLGQDQVLREHSGPGSVQSQQVALFKQTRHIVFRCLLQGADGRRLETKISLVFCRRLTDQALERQLLQQQVGALLIPANFPQGHGSRAPPVRLTGRPGITVSSVGVVVVVVVFLGGLLALGAPHDDSK